MVEVNIAEAYYDPSAGQEQKDLLHREEQQSIFKLGHKCEGVDSNLGVANRDFFLSIKMFSPAVVALVEIVCGSLFTWKKNNRVWETVHCSWKN